MAASQFEKFKAQAVARYMAPASSSKTGEQVSRRYFRFHFRFHFRFRVKLTSRADGVQALPDFGSTRVQQGQELKAITFTHNQPIPTAMIRVSAAVTIKTISEVSVLWCYG